MSRSVHAAMRPWRASLDLARLPADRASGGPRSRGVEQQRGRAATPDALEIAPSVPARPRTVGCSGQAQRALNAPEPAAKATRSETYDDHPFGFAAKFRAIRNLWKKEKQYTRGVRDMTLSSAGDGIVAGGLLGVMSAVGAVAQPWLTTGLAIFTLVEVAASSISYLVNSSRRDDAMARKRQGMPDPEKPNHAQRLVRSGWLEVAGAGLMGTAAFGLMGLGWGVLPVVGLIAAARAMSAVNGSYESGAWNALKFSLGGKEAQRLQVQIPGFIGATEVGLGGITFGAVSLASLQLVQAMAAGPAGMAVTLGALALGGALAALPKMALGRRFREEGKNDR